MTTARHESCGSFQGQAARLIVGKLEQVEATIREMKALRQELQAAMQNLMDPAGGRESGVLECADCRCLGDRPTKLIRQEGGERHGEEEGSEERL